MGCGTAIGAVKFNNFIPWDIDTDTFVNKDIFMKYFGDKNGAGYKAFRESGIKGFNLKNSSV